MSEDARRNGRSTSMAQREKAIRDLIVQNPVPLEKLRALVSRHRNRFPQAHWQIPKTLIFACPTRDPDAYMLP